MKHCEGFCMVTDRNSIPMHNINRTIAAYTRFNSATNFNVTNSHTGTCAV